MSLQVWLPLNGNLKNLGLASLSGGASSPNFAEGKIGALSLNSSSAISFTPTCQMKSTEYTVMMWVKMLPTFTSNSWQTICSLRYKDNSHQTIYATPDKVRYKIEYKPEQNISCDVYGWHHIAYRIDGATVTAFLDGQALTPSTDANGNPERFLSYFTVGGSAYSCINDLRIYDHLLSDKEVKEVSKGLVAHYSLRDRYVENIVNYAPYPYPRDNITANYNWDQALHSKAIQVSSWSAGHNGGVSEPTIGYHAHWQLIDNEPIMVFPNINSLAGKKGRWLGISSSGDLKSFIQSNLTYTISLEARTDTPGACITAGLYYKTTAEGAKLAFNDGHPQNSPLPTGSEWKRYSWTRTTVSNTDTTTNPQIYIYGHYGSMEGTVYVRNVQLEINDHATPYVNPLGGNSQNTYIEDNSGYGNTAQRNGVLKAVLTGVEGRNEYCTQFDANAYIRCGRNAMVKDEITVSWWGQMDDWTAYKTGPMRAISCTEGGGWNFEPGGDYIRFACGTGTTSNTYKLATATTTFTNLGSGWHMFTGTWDGLATKIYIDGVLEGTNNAYTTKTPIFYNSGNGIFIGAEAGGGDLSPDGGNRYAGKMSDVRIYARALNEDEVLDLYRTSASIDNQQNLFGYELKEIEENNITKTGIVKNHSLSSIAETHNMKIKALLDGSTWARIHWLDVSIHNNYFTAAEVADCEKNNRYSKMGLVDKFRSITLTNMIPRPQEDDTGFSSSAVAETSIVKYPGGVSLKVTGAVSSTEQTVASTKTAHYIPGHAYYMRMSIYQPVKVGGADFYWKIAEPSFDFPKATVDAVNTWTEISALRKITTGTGSTWTEGDYPYRLDFDDSSKSGELMYYDGLMLIDLTAAFGEGKEPDRTWCDENISFFTGETVLRATNDVASGQYEFMLTYPDLSADSYNRWIQTSSPNDTTVTGFKAITTAWSGHNGGIRKHGGSCVYDCDTGNTWYAPIGQTAQWEVSSNKYIPSANSTSQKETELWVRIDNLPYKTTTNIYKDLITSNDFIEL